MMIKMKVIERDNYIIDIDGRKRLIANKDAVARILESLVYDNVIDEIVVKIKSDCEECELEALDIVLGEYA